MGFFWHFPILVLNPNWAAPRNSRVIKCRDRTRRFTRVYLLRDILERYGFRVEVKLDALTARIEKQPKEYLIERLKVLGYLLIHTRQIDMVMGDQTMVDRYRRMITGDLD